MDWLLAYHKPPAQVVLSPIQARYPQAWIGDAWPSHAGDLESIMAHAPERVLSGQYTALMLRGRLQRLGVEVQALTLPQTLAEVIEYERRFLQLVGLPASLASPMPAPTPPREPVQRLLLLGPGGIGTGRGTLENDIIEHAGWRNYLRADGQIKLDLEQLVLDPPDAIIWAAPPGQALVNGFADNPLLQRVMADGRWLSSNYWQWQCPGPWTFDLVRQLNQWHD